MPGRATPRRSRLVGGRPAKPSTAPRRCCASRTPAGARLGCSRSWQCMGRRFTQSTTCCTRMCWESRPASASSGRRQKTPQGWWRSSPRKRRATCRRTTATTRRAGSWSGALPMTSRARTGMGPCTRGTRCRSFVRRGAMASSSTDLSRRRCATGRSMTSCRTPTWSLEIPRPAPPLRGLGSAPHAERRKGRGRCGRGRARLADPAARASR